MFHINGRGLFSNTTEVNPDEVEAQLTVFPEVDDIHIGSTHYVASKYPRPAELPDRMIVAMEKDLKGTHHRLAGEAYTILDYRVDNHGMPVAGQLNFAMQSLRVFRHRNTTEVTFEETQQAPDQQATELICTKGIVRALFNVADGTQSYKPAEV